MKILGRQIVAMLFNQDIMWDFVVGRLEFLSLVLDDVDVSIQHNVQYRSKVSYHLSSHFSRDGSRFS